MRFLLGKGLGDPGIDYYLADGERNKGIISNCRYKVRFGFEEKEGEEANLVQTTAVFGVKRGLFLKPVDAGFPLQSSGIRTGKGFPAPQDLRLDRRRAMINR